jgi:hypothetical protein
MHSGEFCMSDDIFSVSTRGGAERGISRYSCRDGATFQLPKKTEIVVTDVALIEKAAIVGTGPWTESLRKRTLEMRACVEDGASVISL